MARGQPHENAVPIPSEAIEPFASMIIGRMFARCEAAKASDDEHALESACQSLWWALSGLNRISIAVSTCAHFSVAVGNEHRRVASYIESVLGVNPLDHKNWGGV